MYKTIKGNCYTEFTEKKSRFLSYACHIKSETQAINFLNQIKDKHWDATHHVYAYILKKDNIQKYSDDGEPHGTAGVPILNTLIKLQIYDIIVIVTRYFGGTLLGTGGLVRAYSNSCKLVINNATIDNIYLCQIVYINFDYKLYSQIKKLLSNYHHKILNKIYDQKVSLKIAIHASSYEKLSTDLLELTSGNIEIKNLDKLEMSLL